MRLFKLLFEIEWALVAVVESRNASGKGAQLAEAAEHKAKEFQDEFWLNCFLFDETVGQEVQQLLHKLYKMLQNFRNWIDDPNPSVRDEIEGRREIVRQFAEDVRPLFRKIESRFRRITGLPEEKRPASWPQSRI